MFDFNNLEMVTNKLDELKERNIPVMTIDKLCKIDEFSYLKRDIESATEEEVNKCNEYFSRYCEHGYNNGHDIFSDEHCYFYWGLVHGEMVTNDNGMSRTYYHYLTLGGDRIRIALLLQYHPSVYSFQNDEDENDCEDEME